MQAYTISAWWFPKDDWRDAGGFADRTIGFLKRLEGVEVGFANLSLSGTRQSPLTMDRGRYCSYIERKQFVFALENGRLKGGRRVGFSAGVVTPTHVSAGEVRVEASQEFFADQTLVRSVFCECIGYWSAEEAGIFSLDAGKWRFWWRWTREGLGESPVPDIPWNPSPSQQQQLDGGLLCIWPQNAPGIVA